jgi:succinate dehydrogenase/fumarate reductase flavoprotein subunit
MVADVVVVGAGACGLPAAIVAREAGASVIVVEAEADIGGHAITSGGNVPLGGGHAAQRAAGIADSPDLIFRDLTDWSVTQSNGAADYRYNDRAIVRAFADHNVFAYEWLLAHGVVFVDTPPDSRGGVSVGNSAPRELHAAAMDWPMVQTGRPLPPEVGPRTSTGNGLMRPLERAARACGVEILLEHRMTRLVRDAHGERRVRAIEVSHAGRTFTIDANAAVIIATGGSLGNVAFRRMFDPRLTEEYCGLAGMPWSDQDASGEIAAMEVGAALWGLANQTAEFGFHLTKPARIGTQYGYQNLAWEPGSRVFEKARATGLLVRDWQDVVLVNLIGERFYDETAGGFRFNNYDWVPDYEPHSRRNAQRVTWEPQNFLNAALAGIGDGHDGGGPIWAIFDADACERNGWIADAPHVDEAHGFFFRAESIDALARAIVMRYQRVPMPPERLARTIARYNGFVDAGVDLDFDKPSPRWEIARPPFFAAWATPVLHDTRSGLRIDASGRVHDLRGEVIAGLYCGGESAGGFSHHALARAIVQGLLSGRHAAAQRGRPMSSENPNFVRTE